MNHIEVRRAPSDMTLNTMSWIERDKIREPRSGYNRYLDYTKMSEKESSDEDYSTYGRSPRIGYITIERTLDAASIKTDLTTREPRRFNDKDHEKSSSKKGDVGDCDQSMNHPKFA